MVYLYCLTRVKSPKLKIGIFIFKIRLARGRGGWSKFCPLIFINVHNFIMMIVEVITLCKRENRGEKAGGYFGLRICPASLEIKTHASEDSPPKK